MRSTPPLSQHWTLATRHVSTTARARVLCLFSPSRLGSGGASTAQFVRRLARERAAAFRARVGAARAFAASSSSCLHGAAPASQRCHQQRRLPSIAPSRLHCKLRGRCHLYQAAQRGNKQHSRPIRGTRKGNAVKGQHEPCLQGKNRGGVSKKN